MSKDFEDAATYVRAAHLLLSAGWLIINEHLHLGNPEDEYVRDAYSDEQDHLQALANLLEREALTRG